MRALAGVNGVGTAEGAPTCPPWLTKLGVGVVMQSRCELLVCMLLPPVTRQPLPPVGALVLGLWALNDVEKKPRAGGRALAMTGTVAGLIGVLWSVTVIMVLIVKVVQG